MAGIAAALCLAGCSSPKDEARDDASSRARTNAETVRGQIAAAARGTRGAAQLSAVKAVLPDVPLVATQDGDGVRVDGALTAESESGGGLSYESVIVRICLRYTVAADSGETTVADADCSAETEAAASADETITLED